MKYVSLNYEKSYSLRTAVKSVTKRVTKRVKNLLPEVVILN